MLASCILTNVLAVTQWDRWADKPAREESSSHAGRVKVAAYVYILTGSWV